MCVRNALLSAESDASARLRWPAWWRCWSTRGRCQVHRRCIAGRRRSVAWLAGCGRVGSAGHAVRLRFARAAWRASGPPAGTGGAPSRRLRLWAGGRGAWCDRAGRFCRAGLGRKPWQAAGNGRSGRISEAQQYDVPVLARRLRQAGASVIAEPKPRMAGGSRRIGRSSTQLDFAGHDPEPASR